MRMNRFIPIMVLLLYIGTGLFAADGVFRSVSGKVEYRNPGGSWQRASVGADISKGTEISTGFNSEARLEIASATLVVKALTRMSLEDLVKKEGVVSTNLRLKVGRVRAEVKSTEGLRNDFKLRSPLSTAAVKGTSFEYDGLSVKVFNGKVLFSDVNNIGGMVSGGESGSAPGGRSPVLGSAWRRKAMMVYLSTLPQLYESGDLIIPIEGLGSLDELEYGSFGGTVTVN
jgi:molybdopterin-binding protein